MTAIFQPFAFDLTEAEKKQVEVYPGLSAFRLTALSYLVLPAPPMVTRLSRVSSPQLWCRLRCFQGSALFQANVTSPS
jgi:hypothetical protein